MKGRGRSSKRDTCRDDSVWSSGVILLGTLGLFLVLLGGGWDVAWHIAIGRETFWSPPHTVLYSGITLVLAALGWGLLQAWCMRGAGQTYTAGPALSLPFGLRISAGLFMAGVGAFMAMTSAPIDELWHRTFGLDVTIWSPPHLQLIFGLTLIGLGLLAALAGEMNHARPTRLSARLPGLDTDARSWALHLLGAFFTLMLLGVLDEYYFDIPQYSLTFFPILLALLAISTLMAGARAAGQRWSATLIGLLSVGLLAVLRGELILIGLGNVKIYLLYLPVTGLVIDLLWSRFAQAYRLWAVLGIGAVTAAVFVPVQMTIMGWLTQVSWVAYLLAIVTGALGALIGARVGMALRPGVELDRVTEVHQVMVAKAGAPLTAMILFVLSGTLVRAHGAPPASIEIQLSDADVVVGNPIEIEVQVEPAEAVTNAKRFVLNFGRGEHELKPALEPTGTPGHYRTTVTLPKPGQWFMGIWFETDHDVWLDWVWLEAVNEAGEPPLNQERYALALELSGVYAPEDVPQGLLQAGKGLVSVWIGILAVVSLLGLRRIEMDGLALATRQA